LAQNIKANLNGDSGNVTIWASTAKRAKGTAEIIRQELGVSKLVEYEELWSDSYSGPLCQDSFGVIKKLDWPGRYLS
jgi:phosphohistidine phosphatase SixA